MNKTAASQFVESVHGTIIGEHRVTARLISKRTGNQNGYGTFLNDQEAREWAEKQVERLKSELGDEYKRLFGTDGFELRIWD